MAGVVALLVAVAGGVQAFRSPASTGVLHDRQARRRYGVAVGVEFGVSLTTVALVALVAGLVTDVAPSTVTGIGAGTLLTLFGLAALAGDPAEGTSQLSSPRQREG